MNQSVTTSWIAATGEPRSVTTERDASETPAQFRNRHYAAIEAGMQQYPI